MQYNGLFAQIAKTKALINQQTAAYERMESILSAAIEGEVPPAIFNFFKSSLHWSYTHLIYVLYAEHRAYQYYSATMEAMPALTALNVGAISAVQQKIGSNLSGYISGNPPGTIKNVLFEIDESTHPEVFQDFPTTKKITFDLPLDFRLLADWNVVKASEVTPIFPDLGTPNGKTIVVGISLSGNYLVRQKAAPHKGATFCLSSTRRTVPIHLWRR